MTIAACWDVTPNTALDAYFISLYLLFLTMTLTFIVILLCDFILLYLAFIISYHFYIYIYFSCLLSTFFPSSYILSFFSCNIFFQPTHRCSPSLLFPISGLFLFGLLLCPEARSKMLFLNVDTCVSDCTNYIPCNSNLYTHCCENLKSQMPLLAQKFLCYSLCSLYPCQIITSSSISKYLCPYTLLI